MQTFEADKGHPTRILQGTGRGRRAGAASLLMLALTGIAGAAEFPQGLVLHFSFDAAQVDGVVVERTGRSHDGRALGAIWTAAGKRGGGCAFASSNACLTVPDIPALTLTQATYAVWFQTPASNTLPRTLFDKPRAPRCVLDITGETSDPKDRGRVRASFGRQSCLSDTVVTDGAWHHTAATFDGATLTLYVDGVLQKRTSTQPDAPPAADGNLAIGLNPTGLAAGAEGHPFVGTLDDVMIFNHVLTEEDIGAVIASVKPKFTPEQVDRRLKELKDLRDRGLLLQDFYDRKVKECETDQ